MARITTNVPGATSRDFAKLYEQDEQGEDFKKLFSDAQKAGLNVRMQDGITPNPKSVTQFANSLGRNLTNAEQKQVDRWLAKLQRQMKSAEEEDTVAPGGYVWSDKEKTSTLLNPYPDRAITMGVAPPAFDSTTLTNIPYNAAEMARMGELGMLDRFQSLDDENVDKESFNEFTADDQGFAYRKALDGLGGGNLASGIHQMGGAVGGDDRVFNQEVTLDDIEKLVDMDGIKLGGDKVASGIHQTGAQGWAGDTTPVVAYTDKYGNQVTRGSAIPTEVGSGLPNLSVGRYITELPAAQGIGPLGWGRDMTQPTNVYRDALMGRFPNVSPLAATRVSNLGQSLFRNPYGQFVLGRAFGDPSNLGKNIWGAGMQEPEAFDAFIRGGTRVPLEAVRRMYGQLGSALTRDAGITGEASPLGMNLMRFLPEHAPESAASNILAATQAALGGRAPSINMLANALQGFQTRHGANTGISKFMDWAATAF